MTQDEIKLVTHMITTVNDEGNNLTEWELGFMESITAQFETKNWISDRQREILERIYAQKTP